MNTTKAISNLTGLTACTFLATAGLSSALDKTPSTAMSPRIVSTHTVRKGDGGLLTFQRIEPPVIVAKAPEGTVARPESLLPLKSLAVGAHVYEGSLTEVKWTHEGLTYKAWSSLDFRLLQGLGWFQAPGVRWHFMAMIGVEQRGHMEARAARLRNAGVMTAVTPDWPVFPPEVLAAVPPGLKAWYVLLESPGTPEQEVAACTGIDALHMHAEANFSQLQRQRVVREQQQAKEAAWKTAHPEPTVKNTVIQFWPLKNKQPLSSGSRTAEGHTNSDEGAAP